MAFLNFYHSHANSVLIGRSLVITMTQPSKILTYTTIEGMMGTKQIEISIIMTVIALTLQLTLALKLGRPLLGECGVHL